MAIFERNVQDRMVIDDTMPLHVEFLEPETVNGHTEYVIELYREPNIEEKWVVKQRYSDFVKLHASLKTPTINLPVLPPKKVFGNTAKEFINDRKLALKEYLKDLLEIPYVTNSFQVRKFLDPETYDGNYLEEARQNLLIALRSGGSFEVTHSIQSLGTRLRKYNFIGFPLSNPRNAHLLWWSPFGPDRNAHIRDIHTVLTALVHCQHPYIVSAVSCVATESGVCVIRPWFSQGSLRDYIYGVKPNFESVVKYTNNRRREISMKTCAVFGRQILEAILFLHKKGIAHGALHTGNVVIENNVCRLLDLENQILGLPHLLRNHMTKIKKINSMEALDIYCFGHILYEMVFHNPLESEVCDSFPSECSPLCRSVLESILSTEACKNGLPTSSALLTHPFFNEVPLHSYEKPSLKLSPAIKETLNLTYENILKRLKEDQKKVKLMRQKHRAEAILAGESFGTRNNKSSHCKRYEQQQQTSNSVSHIGNSDTDARSSKEDDKLKTVSYEAQPELETEAAAPGKDIETSSDRQFTEDNSSSSSLKQELLCSISNFDKNKLKKI